MDTVRNDSFFRLIWSRFVAIILGFWNTPKWPPYLMKLKRELKPMFSFDRSSKDIGQFGLTSPEDARTKENPRCLASDRNALDSINLWGADSAGNALMLRVGRRQDRISEVWIYLRLQSGEEFQAPIQPEVRVFNTDGRSFSARGLYFEVLEPLKRMRIGFNGQLRKGVKNVFNSDEGETVDVQFNFIWHPMFKYSAYPLDFNPVLMAESLSKQKFPEDCLGSWSISTTEWHEQWGQLHGPVTVDRKQYTLMLTGTKTREHGIWDWSKIEKRLVIKGLDSIATGVTLYGKSDEDGSIKVFHGQVALPSNSGLLSVSECSVDRAEGFFDNDIDKVAEVNINLVADTRKYDIKLDIEGPGFSFYAGENWEVHGSCHLTKLMVNGHEGFALVETYRKYGHGSPVVKQSSVRQLKEPEIAASEKLVVLFSENACQSCKIVGGKGSSLALMTSMISKENEFHVPPGLCLTKTSFEQHLADHPAIEEAIEDLQDVAWIKKPGKLAEECERVHDLILNSSLSKNLLAELKVCLKQVFDIRLDDVRLAVRSSALGEDSEEMSAAGQNETFLGVRGLEKTQEAILKCWASQFAFRSVEYKRQNGQLINSGMGVVIQEMVPADFSGVLFSKDPTNGSLARMAITANYGLGESVVSAAADPDTVMLNRTWSDQLSVAEKTVGRKEMRTVMSDDGGTIDVKPDDTQVAEFTVSDELAVRLSRVAVDLERAFGSARDIEWAVHQDKIFLLQARPVTSDSVLTDFEVLHEFDSAFRTSTEYLTTGNVSEVLPGALSPLSLTSNLLAMGANIDRMLVSKLENFRFDPTVLGGFCYYTSHAFFDYLQQKAAIVMDKERGMMSKSMDVGVFGKVIDDTDVMTMARQRFEKPSKELRKMMMSLAMAGIFKGNKIVTEVEAKFRNLPNITVGATTPQEAYDRISAKLLESIEVNLEHTKVSVASMLWNNFILILLAGGKDFNTDHYADFAAIIGSSIGAESGEVPFNLQEIAATIAEELDTKEFSSMQPQEALDLLQNSSKTAYAKFQKFLARHGHRGMKEFDVSSISWGMNPLSVIKMLQGMTKNPISFEKKESTSASDVLKSLKTPLSIFKKKLLSWLMTRSRNGICYRERAKSVMIYFMNCLRISFRHLAKLLVEHGHIPDADLMFFMTFEEVGDLIKTRSARIIMRARRRLRQYSYMDAIIYPEITVGIPKPVNEGNDEEIPEGTMQVEALPVSHGRVSGLAKVITFAEVDTLEPGDILITHATDIGWSPYFPILGGVVTEIGGLISHGAVVAREYGLPCVISAVNATKVFKTGDRVLLDATTGRITKLSEEEPDK